VTTAKPIAVVYAERSLWIWLAWTCLYGAYQAWGPGSHAGAEIAEQFQDIIAITPGAMQSLTVVAYVLAALSVAWLVVKIGDGKTWARRSLLVTFILEVLWAVGQPSAGLMDYLTDVPDLGLQAFALYQLYTAPSRQWFKAAPA
jgi:hypothetical protein